LDRASDF